MVLGACSLANSASEAATSAAAFASAASEALIAAAVPLNVEVRNLFSCCYLPDVFLLTFQAPVLPRREREEDPSIIAHRAAEIGKIKALPQYQAYLLAVPK